MYQMKPVTEKLNIYIGFFVVSGVFGKFIWREIGGKEMSAITDTTQKKEFYTSFIK